MFIVNYKKKKTIPTIIIYQNYSVYSQLNCLFLSQKCQIKFFSKCPKTIKVKSFKYKFTFLSKLNIYSSFIYYLCKNITK